MVGSSPASSTVSNDGTSRHTDDVARYVNTTKSKQGDLGSLLPHAPSGTVWTAGKPAEVSWSIMANHGGGYQYRRGGNSGRDNTSPPHGCLHHSASHGGNPVTTPAAPSSLFPEDLSATDGGTHFDYASPFTPAGVYTAGCALRTSR